jgi:hypothetical protein
MIKSETHLLYLGRKSFFHVDKCPIHSSTLLKVNCLAPLEFSLTLLAHYSYTEHLFLHTKTKLISLTLLLGTLMRYGPGLLLWISDIGLIRHWLVNIRLPSQSRYWNDPISDWKAQNIISGIGDIMSSIDAHLSYSTIPLLGKSNLVQIHLFYCASL